MRVNQCTAQDDADNDGDDDNDDDKEDGDDSIDAAEGKNNATPRAPSGWRPLGQRAPRRHQEDRSEGSRKIPLCLAITAINN